MPMIRGYDVLAQAQSGTGKTASYAIGVLQRVTSDAHCQALVLVPTCELSAAIRGVFKRLADYMPGVKSDEEWWKRAEDTVAVRDEIAGAQIVVGTPGRVHRMISQGALRLSQPAALDEEAAEAGQLRTLILDELDEMFSRGFEGLIVNVLEACPDGCQRCLFLASMPQNLVGFAERNLAMPVKLLIKRDELSLEGMRQYYIAVEREEWKLDTLCDLLDDVLEPTTPRMVFCNIRRNVLWLAERKAERDYQSILCMHGDETQQERTAVWREFQNGTQQLRVLITTDLFSFSFSWHADIAGPSKIELI